jgi:glucose/mannose-6-phosphate isomerase
MSTTERFALDRDTIARVDVSDHLTDILAIPEHLRDALWKVESAGLDSWDSRGGIIVAGMGGSAIGGELARSILGDHASRPLITARAYGLPSWTTNETTVVCASYSGNTEETLACYEAAGVIGARRVVVTAGGELAELARADSVPVIPVAGGYQPRAAVAYLTVAVLEVAALAGVGPRMNSDIDVAADHLEELVIAWGPDGGDDTEAKRLARSLYGTIPIVAGAGLTTAIAYRWKTQINENAKVPSYAQELPEMDHNEIEGWSSGGEFGRFSAVFLDDDDTHPRVKERMELTSRLIRPGAAGVHRVNSRGRTPVERVFSLVLLGDLVSLYLAVLRGVDPEPVELLSALKAELGRE